MNLHLHTDRETDGRWLAEISELPGVLVYGFSRDQAVTAAKVLALRVLADRLDAGELAVDFDRLHFTTPAI